MKIQFLVAAFLLSVQPAYAKPLKLVLNWKPEPQFGGFYTAQLEGFFKKNSLDVDIIPGGSGTPTAQIVGAGQTEFGIVSAEEIPISWAHGSEIVALFAVYQTYTVCFVTHPENNFKSIQDIFNSKTTLSVQQGLPFFIYLEKKLGKPKAQIVPASGGIGNFLSNTHFSQQALCTAEPILLHKRGIKTKDFKIADEGFNPYLTVLVARKDFIEKNTETVKKMVAAIREGWRAYLDHPARTNTLMHQLNPSMDLETFRESAEVQKEFIETKETRLHGLGIMTQERWKTLVDHLKMVGLINKPIQVLDLFRNF